MKKAAVILVVLVIIALSVAEARAAALGVTGDGLRFVRRRLYKWAGLALAIAALMYGFPLLVLSAGWSIGLAVAAFVAATAIGDVRGTFQGLGLWPSSSGALECPEGTEPGTYEDPVTGWTLDTCI